MYAIDRAGKIGTVLDFDADITRADFGDGPDYYVTANLAFSASPVPDIHAELSPADFRAALETLGEFWFRLTYRPAFESFVSSLRPEN